MFLSEIYPPPAFAAARASHGKIMPPLAFYSGDYTYAVPPVLPQADPWVPDAMKGPQAQEWAFRVMQPYQGAIMAAKRQLNNTCWYMQQDADEPYVEDQDVEEVRPFRFYQ
jgi:hypothetical protein